MLASDGQPATAVKLGDLGGTRNALAGFGLPDRLLVPASVALPLVELAVAGLMIPTNTARVGAPVAAALLLVFAIMIGRLIARGQRVDCNCLAV